MTLSWRFAIKKFVSLFMTSVCLETVSASTAARNSNWNASSIPRGELRKQFDEDVLCCKLFFDVLKSELHESVQTVLWIWIQKGDFASRHISPTYLIGKPIHGPRWTRRSAVAFRPLKPAFFALGKSLRCKRSKIYFPKLQIEYECFPSRSTVSNN